MIINEARKGKKINFLNRGRGKEYFCNFFAMTANCSFGARAFFLRAKSHYRVMVGLINSTRHRNGVNTRDAGSRNKCPLTAEDKNQGREGFLRCSFWNFSDHQPLSQGHFSVVLLFHLT